MTGKSEWSEKNKKERIYYYINMFVASIFIPGFYSVIIGLLSWSFLPIRNDETHAIVSIFITVLLFVIGSIIIFLGFRTDIRDSLNRKPLIPNKRFE